MASITIWDCSSATVQMRRGASPEEEHRLELSFNSGHDEVDLYFADSNELHDFIEILKQQQPAERLPF